MSNYKQRCEEYLQKHQNTPRINPMNTKLMDPKNKQRVWNQSIVSKSNHPAPPNRISRLCTQSNAEKDKFKNKGSTWEGLLTNNTGRDLLISSRPTSVSSALMTTGKSEVNFHQFDPFLTLQFLTLELSSKLKKILPDDKNIHKILYEIKHTIRRFDSSSGSCRSSPSVVFQDKVKKRNQSSETENLKMCFSDKALQTDLHKTEEIFPTNDFNQERTEYETKYNALEAICESLRDEKIKAVDDVLKYKDEIFHLKKEINLLEHKLKNISENSEKNAITGLEEQCNRLQMEIKTLQNMINEKQNSNNSLLVDELNAKLEKSCKTINELERKRYENDKTLVFTTLEKEKLSILLNSREKQVIGIQKELSEIQCLVHEQLETMQNNTMRQMPLDKFSKSELILNVEGSCKDILKKTLFLTDCFPERENCEKDEKNSDKFGMDFKYDEFKAIFDNVTLPSPAGCFKQVNGSEISFDFSQTSE